MAAYLSAAAGLLQASGIERTQAIDGPSDWRLPIRGARLTRFCRASPPWLIETQSLSGENVPRFAVVAITRN
jgi:hypothetical protein